MAFNITAISGQHFAPFFSWQNAAVFASDQANTYSGWSSTISSAGLTACQDAANLWEVSGDHNGAFTLQNCMVYPIIAQLRSQKLLLPAADKLAADYGILPNVNATFSWPSINNCIADYCLMNSDVEGCKSPRYQIGELKPVNQKSQPFNFTLNFNENICDGLEASADTDLAGPGVFISYIMQMGIVALTWLVLRFYDSWSKLWLTAWFYVQERGWAADKHDNPEDASACDRALKRHVKLRESKGRAIFVDAVKDFHKAQCFYMLTFQVALIVALTHQGTLQATSYQQYWNDLATVSYLLLGGCLPIVLVYLMLRLSERPTQDKNGNVLSTKDFRMEQPKYMACITLCTTAIGLSNATILWNGGDSQTAAIAGNQLQIPSCGGNYSPVQYCSDGEWWKFNNTRIHGFAVFAWTALAYLLQDISKKHRPKFMGWPQDRKLGRAFRLLVEVGLVCSNVYLAYAYGRLLWSKHHKGTIAWGDSAWSLGQIIAVAIWIPVILQYLWTLAVNWHEARLERKAQESHRSSASLPTSAVAQPTTAAAATSDNKDNAGKTPAVSTSAVQGP